MQAIALKDDTTGVCVQGTLHMSEQGRDGQLVLKVFVQMVVINRTGLPLDFARCAPLPSSSSSSSCSSSDTRTCSEVVQPDGRKARMHLEAAAGQQRVDRSHQKRWRKVGEAWVVCFAEEEDGVSWNELAPQHAILDLPPGSSPCVSLHTSSDQAASPWVMIDDANESDADTNMADTNDSDNSEEGKTFSIQLPGSALFQVDRDSSSEAQEAVGSEHCLFHLGVNMRQGVYPFNLTMYVDVVPKRTIVNQSGYVLQVCQQVHSQK